MLKRCLVALSFGLFLPAALHAQALPAATRAGTLQVGLAGTNANTDYYTKRISGITGYATFDFTPHLGVEADIHYLTLLTPDDFGETSYEAGLRYVYRKGRYEPYAKVLAGIGSGDFQTGSFSNNVHSVSYFEYSLGGGLDVRLGHHINLRAIDFELQRWPNFAPNSLTPSMITVGVAYRLR